MQDGVFRDSHGVDVYQICQELQTTLSCCASRTDFRLLHDTYLDGVSKSSDLRVVLNLQNSRSKAVAASMAC